jgi:hypothetical protein
VDPIGQRVRSDPTSLEGVFKKLDSLPLRQHPEAVDDRAVARGQQDSVDGRQVRIRHAAAQQSYPRKVVVVVRIYRDVRVMVGGGNPVPAGGGRSGQRRAVDGQQRRTVTQPVGGTDRMGGEHSAEDLVPLTTP